MSVEHSITHIRPRFNIPVPTTKDKLLKIIEKHLEDPGEGIKGKIVDNHIILDILPSHVHFWSPQLNFRIEEDEWNPGQTILAGLIGPRPNVWTLFMFFYFSIGILGFFTSSYGISQWMLGDYSHTIWAFPVAVLIMLTAYQAGKLGERLGSRQIRQFKAFIRGVIQEAAEIPLQ